MQASSPRQDNFARQTQNYRDGRVLRVWVCVCVCVYVLSSQCPVREVMTWVQNLCAPKLKKMQTCLLSFADRSTDERGKQIAKTSR